MRQDWIEFKSVTNKKFCVRPEYISSFGQGLDKEEVIIFVGEGKSTSEYTTSEPYERVKQKIMDAERVDLSDVVVEHFTKDEYKRLLALAKLDQEGCKEDNLEDQVGYMQNIIDKLNEIIKEDK